MVQLFSAVFSMVSIYLVLDVTVSVPGVVAAVQGVTTEAGVGPPCQVDADTREQE